MQLNPVDQASYDLIVARLRTELECWPAALRSLAEPSLASLVNGELSRIVALLPVWMSDLAPVEVRTQQRLGLAGLWLWWYGSILDDQIDGAGGPTLLPVAQQALLAALELYRGLGLDATPAWADLQARAIGSANAYARELSTRGIPIEQIAPAQLAVWTIELLIERAAPFAFSAMALCSLSIVASHSRLGRDLPAALAWLAAARQIADDAGDWIEDLGRGQLNYVSAGLIRHFQTYAPADTLGLERLIGYQLSAEDFWTQIESVHTECCRAALESLGAYGPCRLQELIETQQRRDVAAWEQLRAHRDGLRRLFDS